MRIPRAPHSWSVSVHRAVEIQRELASLVRATRPRAALRYAAGVDAAYTEDGKFCVGAAVRWDLESRVALDEATARRRIPAPYIPGLLSFREAPAVLGALRKLPEPVDVILCDAHGLAHPRRFGLACHVGILCDRPTLGCAKSLLIGEHRPLAASRGAHQKLRHRGEVIGAVVRTQEGVRPVYVSVGHRLDLETSIRIVLRTAVRYRLPEPIRLADGLARRLVRLSERG